MKFKRKQFRVFNINYCKKEDALFSVRNGYRKSILLFGWYFYKANKLCFQK